MGWTPSCGEAKVDGDNCSGGSNKDNDDGCGTKAVIAAGAAAATAAAAAVAVVLAAVATVQRHGRNRSFFVLVRLMNIFE